MVDKLFGLLAAHGPPEFPGACIPESRAAVGIHEQQVVLSETHARQRRRRRRDEVDTAEYKWGTKDVSAFEPSSRRRSGDAQLITINSDYCDSPVLGDAQRAAVKPANLLVRERDDARERSCKQSPARTELERARVREVTERNTASSGDRGEARRMTRASLTDVLE